MGFRKTPKGNLIYDFDFTPKKLVPLKYEDCGYDSCYAVEGDNGQRAPILVEFQGQRYVNYGFAFCLIPKEKRDGFDNDICTTSNVQLVAALANLYLKSGDETERFDPWGTDNLASKAISFPIKSQEEANRFLQSNHIPKDGYQTMRRYAE